MSRPRLDLYGWGPEDHDLIQRFEAAYNAIDRFLRRELGRSDREDFSGLVHAYWGGRSRDRDLLLDYAKLRNAIVHTKTAAYSYLASPAARVVVSIEQICSKLIGPRTALERFGGPVHAVAPSDLLADVLRLIEKKDFSQFPVRDGARLAGLLTENGITRWLAKHVARSARAQIDLGRATVGDVLAEQEARDAFCLVSRLTLLEDVLLLFAQRPLLEAALITAQAQETEPLLGIATRWQALRE